MDISYEKILPIIDTCLNAQKHRWHISIYPSIDYDDISQKIRLHIWKKLNMYDPEKGEIEPWIGTIVANQVSNYIKSIYTNGQRPCLRCPYNSGGGACQLYGEQTDVCPEYDKWFRSSKRTLDIKFPISIQYTMAIDGLHSLEETIGEEKEYVDYNYSIDIFNKEMKKILTPFEWRVYEGIFILHKSEKELVKELGYRHKLNPNEPSVGGVREIKKIKEKLFEKAKNVVGEIF